MPNERRALEVHRRLVAERTETAARELKSAIDASRDTARAMLNIDGIELQHKGG